MGKEKAPPAPIPESPRPEELEVEPPPKLSDEDMFQEFLAATNLEEATRHLAEHLELPEYESNPRSAARLDYITYALQFAKEACFGPRRVNALISIANSIIDATIAGATFAEVHATFQTMMLKSTSSRPGADSELFSPDQVAHVAKYFARTFFRHFRLYSYLYSSPQDVAESTAELLVETAIVPSFDNALSESEYFQALDDKRMLEEAAAAEALQAAQEAEEEAATQAAEEAARLAEEQRQADLLRKPATLEDAIEHMVAVRLEEERKLLNEEYTAKEEDMKQRIAELEAKAALVLPTAAAGAKAKKGKAGEPA